MAKSRHTSLRSLQRYARPSLMPWLRRPRRMIAIAAGTELGFPGR